MAKTTFLLVVILFGLFFACVIEATEKNFEDKISHLLWPRKLFRGPLIHHHEVHIGQP
ncbi:unnamed protein product [Brassica oleracea]